MRLLRYAHRPCQLAPCQRSLTKAEAGGSAALECPLGGFPACSPFPIDLAAVDAAGMGSDLGAILVRAHPRLTHVDLVAAEDALRLLHARHDTPDDGGGSMRTPVPAPDVSTGAEYRGSHIH